MKSYTSFKTRSEKNTYTGILVTCINHNNISIFIDYLLFFFNPNIVYYLRQSAIVVLIKIIFAAALFNVLYLISLLILVLSQ